jgi:hypothetical protein
MFGFGKAAGLRGSRKANMLHGWEYLAWNGMGCGIGSELSRALSLDGVYVLKLRKTLRVGYLFPAGCTW